MDRSAFKRAALRRAALVDAETDSFNALWLLLIIPFVLLAALLVGLVWHLHRRRKRRRARQSTLRNVTLVIQEEERAREREEKRLSRANSAITMVRRNSNIHETRERRYSDRVARAVAREQRAERRERKKRSSDATSAKEMGRTPKAASELSRKASAKQRDREVAQRVWRIPGSEMGDSVYRPTPQQLQHDLEAAEFAGFSSGGEASDAEQSIQPGDAPRSPRSSGHQRPAHRRENTNELSVIGESSHSEARPSTDVIRDAGGPYGAQGDQPQASTSQSKEELQTTDALVAAPPLAALAPARTGSTSRKILRNNSQRSAYTTATSNTHYTTATAEITDTDAQSMQTAETSGTVTARPVAAAAAVADDADVTAGTARQQPLRQDSNPFASPTGASSESGYGSNPFASPTRSSEDGLASPSKVSPLAPAVLTTPPSASGHGESSSGADASVVRKLTQVIRLKTPSPRRDRSLSPGSSKIARSNSTASSKHRFRRQVGDGPRPGAGVDKQASASSTSLHRQGLSPAGESWAYTSKASEWKRSSVPDVGGPQAGQAHLPAAPAAAGASNASLADAGGDGANVSLPQGIANKRRWDPRADLSRDPAMATPTRPAPRGLTDASAVDDASGASTPAGAPPRSNMERRPSIGVAGSRFKESFE